MTNKKTKYKLLIHCRISQIREGFESYLDSLCFPVQTLYADLAQEGIVSKLNFSPHLIIILLNESDSDMPLLFKIKMFAGDTPTMLITPALPDKYVSFLKMIGIGKIIQLPHQRDSICDMITEILQQSNGFP